MTAQYTATAKLLHWIMAIALIALLALGFYMHDLPFSPMKLKLYSWHKWAGVCLFLLVFVRVAWRITHRPPTLPEHMKSMERIIAHGGHHMLYLLMIVIPLSGWLMSSAKGFQTVLFGVLPLPDLLEKNEALGGLLQQLHMGLNLFFAAVVIGHVAAALKHHFVNKDDVLRRMLPAKFR
ncbi:cytochrome b [Fluviibacter phosphoraccumulans]|uniref:cytochrome b n=1 Tax=Fluviibacter phosphoraccumulans TaxID=1751046 RepID=UPI0024E198D0|nr:cytochrome b [Fluviibacter phosphoraccumulans]